MSVLVRTALSVTMVILVSAAAVLSGQSTTIQASNGWVKAPAAGAKTAMAFATINNPTAYDVYFTTAVTDAAGKVEFRDASKGTQPAEFAIAPAYGSLAMDQKGVHMMLLDLKRTLKAGEMVALTLTTSDGAKLQVSAAVRN